jgi:hypothetical protein
MAYGAMRRRFESFLGCVSSRSWTRFIKCPCGVLGNNTWYVVAGVWMCECGRPMTVQDIKPYHDELARIDRERKAAEEAAKAAAAAHAPVV